MLKDIELIVTVQGMDIRAAALRKEIASLPKEVAEIEKALIAHLRKLEADKAVLLGNQKEKRAQDGEIQVQQQKIAKLRDQMTSAKTNEQYKAFQHEIEFCENAIKKAEDRSLELMGDFERLDLNVKAAEAALKAEKQQVDKQKAEARERTATDQKALDEIMAERATLTAQVGKLVLTTYEKLAKKYLGAAVAEVVNRRCMSCNLEVRPQLFQDLRKGDRMFVCESCGRILHYNPPTAFEAPESPSSTPAAARSGSGSRVDMS